MENIKTKIYMLGMAAAIMLCGCENSENEPPDLNTESSLTSTVYTSETVKNTEATGTTKTDETTDTTETAKVTEEIPNVTDDINSEFEIREFPDDKIVPSEWIPVYSFAEAVQNFDAIVSADVSGMNAADAIIALANKNVIFMNAFISDVFCELDKDHPYYSEIYKNPNFPNEPIYPIILNYFTDIQEIYDLGTETYTENAIEDFYTPKKGISRRCFMKENGVSYIDVWATPIWDYAPFMYRTYIEILS